MSLILFSCFLKQSTVGRSLESRENVTIGKQVADEVCLWTNADGVLSVHCHPARFEPARINQISDGPVPDISQVAVSMELFTLLLSGILELPAQVVQVHVFLPQIPGEATLQLLQLGLKICVCMTAARTEREHLKKKNIYKLNLLFLYHNHSDKIK